LVLRVKSPALICSSTAGNCADGSGLRVAMNRKSACARHFRSAAGGVIFLPAAEAEFFGKKIVLARNYTRDI